MSEIPDATIVKAWFDYPIIIYPHHTDYAGVVWHGTYINWLEEARVESLQWSGVAFADLVMLGCDLPVIEMSLRYHQSLRMGAKALVRTQLHSMNGVRMKWIQKIQSIDLQTTYLTGTITLVVVDRKKGKIMRQLPPAIKDLLSKLLA
jgi:acyl-CoA thioester hydrolase